MNCLSLTLQTSKARRDTLYVHILYGIASSNNEQAGPSKGVADCCSNAYLKEIESSNPSDALRTMQLLFTCWSGSYDGKLMSVIKQEVLVETQLGVTPQIEVDDVGTGTHCFCRAFVWSF